MKFNVPTNLWDKLNIFSKVLIVTGGLIVDIGFKVSGLINQNVVKSCKDTKLTQPK